MSGDAAHYLEFQGSKIVHVPDQPGLYAWYYRPTAVRRENTPATLARFLGGEVRVSTEVQQRYGVRVAAEMRGRVLLGADRQPVDDAIAEAFREAEPFLAWFFKSAQFANFCRPVYIGIAKNLCERVYNQHYLSLTEYWEDTSRVSRYLATNERASVQDVMDQLDVPHSFALEARVRGVSSKDLMVAALVTTDMPAAIGPDTSASDTSTRRALERLLQLLTGLADGIKAVVGAEAAAAGAGLLSLAGGLTVIGVAIQGLLSAGILPKVTLLPKDTTKDGVDDWLWGKNKDGTSARPAWVDKLTGGGAKPGEGFTTGPHGGLVPQPQAYQGGGSNWRDLMTPASYVTDADDATIGDRDRMPGAARRVEGGSIRLPVRHRRRVHDPMRHPYVHEGRRHRDDLGRLLGRRSRRRGQQPVDRRGSDHSAVARRDGARAFDRSQ